MGDLNLLMTAVGINADLTKFDFKELAEKQKERSGSFFNAILMDPPWNLCGKTPSRGVALPYSTLTNNKLEGLKVTEL